MVMASSRSLMALVTTIASEPSPNQELRSEGLWPACGTQQSRAFQHLDSAACQFMTGVPSRHRPPDS